MRHPIQPLVTENGVVRFRANAIVRHLLDHGGIDMNALARMTFSDEDRAQFAQLIGYSLSGYGSLGYVSDDAYRAAEAMVDGTDERDARIDTLTVELTELLREMESPRSVDHWALTAAEDRRDHLTCELYELAGLREATGMTRLAYAEKVIREFIEAHDAAQKHRKSVGNNGREVWFAERDELDRIAEDALDVLREAVK